MHKDWQQCLLSQHWVWQKFGTEFKWLPHWLQQNQLLILGTDNIVVTLLTCVCSYTVFFFSLCSWSFHDALVLHFKWYQMTNYYPFLISFKQTLGSKVQIHWFLHSGMSAFYCNCRIPLSQTSSHSAGGDVLTFRWGAYKPYLYHCRAKDKQHHKVFTKQVLTFCIEFIKAVFTQDLCPYGTLEK